MITTRAGSIASNLYGAALARDVAQKLAAR
jgi:hypothetical protein